MADHGNRDGVAILAAAPDLPARAVRVNITMPEDLLQAVDGWSASNRDPRAEGPYCLHAGRGGVVGMLVVETIAKIRRAFFVQQKPIKAICRELRLSRKVVRKVLRSEATAFRYERETQPLPKIGPWSADANPHPAKATIAQRMGLSPRTVQRYLASRTSSRSPGCLRSR